jgi:hypothetical protein
MTQLRAAGRIATYTTLIASGVALGLLTGHWLRDDWTAAAQTFVGFVGIGVAIYVPWSQRRSQIEDSLRKEADLRKVMRVALRQPVATFGKRCGALCSKIIDGSWEVEIPPKTLFKRPPEFNQFRAKLHLLGTLGEEVNELIGAQDEAATIVKSIRATRLNLAPSALVDYCERLERYAQTAAHCAERLRLEADL